MHQLVVCNVIQAEHTLSFFFLNLTLPFLIRILSFLANYIPTLEIAP